MDERAEYKQNIGYLMMNSPFLRNKSSLPVIGPFANVLPTDDVKNKVISALNKLYT